ncbi:MAG: MBL fold metallo-hydrolase [Planctomycetota bacterium]
MQLHCLGTAGYHPNETRQTSCYFLPESGILLDAGTGLFRLTEHLCTDTLDILISHAHLDHIAGLTFLIDVLYQRPVDRIRIWGEAKKLEAIREHLFAPLVFPVPLQAEWMPIDAQSLFRIGDCEVSWRRQEHPGGSVGYRLAWPGGPKLLYLTDTTGDVSDEAARWNSDADLMMHECYFSQEYSEWAEKTGHTATHRVAEIASAAMPSKLLLTHANPLSESADELLAETRARLTRPIETLLAEDGLAVEFG